MLDYDKKESEQEEEKKRKECEAEELERQEEIKFANWLIEESEKYIGTEEEKLKDKIFSERYKGKIGNTNHALKLFVLINNIEDERCRRKLCSWLHNDNIASIKVFEAYTGIKMPRTHKDRKEIVNNLKLSDIHKPF